MRRKIATLGAVVATALALAACSNPNTAGAGSGLAADGTAPVKAKELTVWVNAIELEAVKSVYKRFEAKTGVKMNLVEMPADNFEAGVQTRWASGERPDVLEYHATSLFWALNPEQNLYDLSKMPYVAKAGDLFKSAGSFNGKVYAGMIDTPSLFGIFYNKDVFQRNGLTVPKTFADLEQICATLKQKDPKVVPIWESGSSAWPTQILSGLMYMGSAQQSENWAQQVTDKKTTFDAPGSPFVAGLTQYEKFKDTGCFNKDATTAKFEDGLPALAKGQAAMIALPSGLVDMIADQFQKDKAATAQHIGFAYPSAQGAVSIWAPNVAGTWYVPKTGDTDRESSALAFIQYATGDGYQEYVDESGTFPLLQGAQPPKGGYTGLAKDFYDAYEDSTAYAFNSNLSGFNSAFPNYMTGILGGSETPEGAAQKSQKVFEQAAKAAKLPGW